MLPFLARLISFALCSREPDKWPNPKSQKQRQELLRGHTEVAFPFDTQIVDPID
jgi:hypothetical protein